VTLQKSSSTGNNQTLHTAIKKIFIANRGEIARRIAQSAKKLGLETVALTDKSIPPAYLADVVTKFIHIQDETTGTYLNQSSLIDYAKMSGCDAVHPGFGFLSENAEFASSVIKAGLTWVGPRPGAIDAMASKATARGQATKAQVPCLPGLNGLDLEHGGTAALHELEQFASKTGFPLLMKASYGGGGKGMRIVNKKEELIESAKRASTDAVSSFGNGSLIVEKYLPAPRHVEVQVLADKHGNVCVLGDRDCSLQRRHQKILEEAPAPNIPAPIREAMHHAAKNLASAVGYDNAGTVEFLLDETQSNQVTFYFLEMNTRLQVEHTVTEEVFNIDLVEWQIRVARGEQLPIEFASLKPRGHSIEVRIYAEDPGTNFFPAPGPVRAFVPATGRGIRWEIGMDTVDQITSKFDPMISKLICTAGDRKQALELLAQTLERTLFAGPRNNIQFLIWLARHPRIIERPMDTHFIAANVGEALNWESNAREALETEVDILLSAIEGRQISSSDTAIQHMDGTPTVNNLTNAAFAIGSSTKSARPLKLATQVTMKQITWSPVDPHSTSRYGFGRFDRGANQLRPFSFVIFQSPSRTEYWLGINGHNWVRVDERASTVSSLGGTDGSDGMTAPVPGKVIQVNLAAGASITTGQVLFVLESMKMQFEVKAARDGKAAKTLVAAGDQVTAGQVLAEWEEA
jgi:acetyl/propionyl-CoA carboxylase alpha subunit